MDGSLYAAHIARCGDKWRANTRTNDNPQWIGPEFDTPQECALWLEFVSRLDEKEFHLACPEARAT